MSHLSSLNELAKVSNKIAHEKGWWESLRSKSALTLLMQSEVAEIIEYHRDHRKPSEIWYEGGVPYGIPIELADFVIRVADYAHGWIGCDLEKIMTSLPVISNVNNLEEYLARMNWAISMSWNTGPQEVLPEDFYLTLAIKYAFELAKAFEIDLWAAINEKTEYNKTRPYRHGGKRI